MKAIIFTQEGFRKDITISKKVPFLRTPVYTRVSIREVSPRDIQETVPILEYGFVRSFINEYDEEILIYKEL